MLVDLDAMNQGAAFLLNPCFATVDQWLNAILPLNIDVCSGGSDNNTLPTTSYFQSEGFKDFYITALGNANYWPNGATLNLPTIPQCDLNAESEFFSSGCTPTVTLSSARTPVANYLPDPRTVPLTGPQISSLSATSGAVRSGVTIDGSNFGDSQGSSTVTLNGVTAQATSWGAAAINITVPNTTSGTIVVTVGGAASNAFSFTVTSTSANANIFGNLNWTNPSLDLGLGIFGGAVVLGAGSTAAGIFVPGLRNAIFPFFNKASNLRYQRGAMQNLHNTEQNLQSENNPSNPQQVAQEETDIDKELATEPDTAAAGGSEATGLAIDLADSADFFEGAIGAAMAVVLAEALTVPEQETNVETLANNVVTQSGNIPDVATYLNDSSNVGFYKLQFIWAQMTSPEVLTSVALPPADTSQVLLVTFPNSSLTAWPAGLTYTDWSGVNWHPALYGPYFVQTGTDSSGHTYNSISPTIQFWGPDLNAYSATRVGNKFLITQQYPINGNQNLDCASNASTGVVPPSTNVTQCASYVTSSFTLLSGASVTAGIPFGGVAYTVSVRAPPAFTGTNLTAFTYPVSASNFNNNQSAEFYVSGYPSPSVSIASTTMPNGAYTFYPPGTVLLTCSDGNSYVGTCPNGLAVDVSYTIPATQAWLQDLGLTGSPNTTTFASLTLQATNAAGSVTQTFTIPVVQATPPQNTDILIADFAQAGLNNYYYVWGVPNSQTYISQTSLPLTLSLQNSTESGPGQLPPGLSFADDGSGGFTISGTPTGAAPSPTFVCGTYGGTISVAFKTVCTTFTPQVCPPVLVQPSQGPVTSCPTGQPAQLLGPFSSTWQTGVPASLTLQTDMH